MSDELFQFLLGDSDRRPLTVSELTAEIRGALERTFANIWVEGEVVNFIKAASGHWYFNLNDGFSQIRCVCFKGTNFRIRFQPQNGLKVSIRGRVTIYDARGELQLSVDSLEPSGEGALAVAFEQIRARLEREGLFAEELKRPIPFLPRRVAVVTSKSGAAFHDIYNVLTRRARSVGILLVPSLVQGEGAADSLRRAIIAVNAYSARLKMDEKIDVMIVGRGGGSAEDLWAFNDEALARTIRSSDIPIISAVGHEIDWTIADMVADLRAATPSAAAEMVAGLERDILDGLLSTERAMYSILENRLLGSRAFLDDKVNRIGNRFKESFLAKKLRFSKAASTLSPEPLRNRLLGLENRLSGLDHRRGLAQHKLFGAKSEALRLQIAKLDALSPLSVLTRGYSITQTDTGAILRDAASVKIGDKLKIRLERGKLEAEVFSVDN